MIRAILVAAVVVSTCVGCAEPPLISEEEVRKQATELGYESVVGASTTFVYPNYLGVGVKVGACTGTYFSTNTSGARPYLVIYNKNGDSIDTRYSNLSSQEVLKTPPMVDACKQ